VLRLLGAVSALLVLALVVPAVVAVRLNRTRVERAERDVRAIADALRREGRVPGVDGVEVLVGPGAEPQVRQAAWRSRTGHPLEGRTAGLPLTPDPWGNQYIALASADSLLLVSAGPNGVIDSSFITGVSDVRGDDVALRRVSR